MRRAAILAIGLWIAASFTQAQAQILPGAPAVSDEVKAAFGRVRTAGPAELVRLADAGLADGQAYAGVILAFASSDAAEVRKGCGYLQSASAARSDAMHFLGESYQQGRCGAIDLEKAIAAFHKAGDMGLAKSRCAEGNVLLQLGREQARAIHLCTEGAEGGDPDAQTDLGNFYLQGRLVAKDPVKARRWYEKAAAQGQRNAAFTLGQIYWYGDGVPKDNAAAARFWRMAYENGRADAAALLGDEAFVRTFPDYAAGKARPGQTRIDEDALFEAIGWYEKALPNADAKRTKDIQGRLKLLKEFKSKGPAAEAAKS